MRATLERPVDGASLAMFRIAFGVVMLIAIVRFAAMGWIDELYVRPTFHFAFWGFEWVRPWPGIGMHVHFAALGVLAAMIALGVRARVAALLFTIGFAYVELCDATYYLNHYYAIVLFGALLAATPCDRVFAWDARGRRDHDVPFAAILALRAQLGIVYVFAGLAKLNADWLVHGEPLRTWLLARTDVPILGPLFVHHEVALAMSWAGALFDLSIPFLLSSRRTRALAYVAVVAFHLTTAALFRIGMFPWVMIALTPIFFAPDWPRRLRRAAPIERARERIVISPLVLAALGAWMLVQIALPLRHLAYDRDVYAGDRLWTGEGMRWAWHVMISERAGLAELRAIDDEGRSYTIDPSRELTPLQVRMMAIEPDLLLRYAHHVRDEHARRGEHVRVHADVFVSLNGRRSRRLVDPEVDLASQDDGLGGYAWVYRRDEAPLE
ncbi:HTTM domain-containing protein [Sandaracinus amylolyticus]|uniref:Vitamin K-dependent gamma-carboxylase n=1 Tax=Sandaracinus amylolyticus TaxID=927083 RepID=A0A0F6W5M4_9BACT|nr:HTTM domain-containing protein [Sandaracinus amylolyticus]AKF08023.1 Vitamin K-dependent gamma-carboxylase [Sandaracinus amylolyticus]